MAGSLKSCNVKGGMIKIICDRCNKKRYIQIVAGTRRKTVRCTCGMSGAYKINYRRNIREATSRKALAILNNAKEAMIRLCDTSATGIGFIVPQENILSLYRGQEIRIKYKGSTGVSQRKIQIKNIVGNRIGGQYA